MLLGVLAHTVIVGEVLSGSVLMVADAVAVTPLSSVTVTVYVVDERLLTVFVVEEVLNVVDPLLHA